MISDYNQAAITENAADICENGELKGYISSWEYLKDELKLFDLVLLGYLHTQQAGSENPYAGAVITRDEIYGLLYDNAAEYDDSFVKAEIGRMNMHIAKRLELTIKSGTHLSVPQISKLLKLSKFEEKCIIACLAPEVDKKYERIYGYLQNDATEKSPDVDLLMKIFLSAEERIAARKSFCTEAPIIKSLMELHNDLSDSCTPLISRHLKLDDWIVNYLLDVNVLDSRLVPFTELVHAGYGYKDSSSAANNSGLANNDDKFTVNQDMIFKFLNYYRYVNQKKSSRIFYFYGPDGSGKRDNVMAMCSNLGISLIIADASKMLDYEQDFDEALRLLGRQVFISKCALCLENFDFLITSDRSGQKKVSKFLKMLSGFAGTTFILGRSKWHPENIDSSFSFVAAEFFYPIESERRNYWDVFSRNYKISDSTNLNSFSQVFRFTPGQIQTVLRLGESYSVWNGMEDGTIRTEDLVNACYTQSNRKLGELATKVNSLYKMEMLVLPEDQMSQMQEICRQVKYRSLVYEKWGFEKRLSLGKGLNILFSGPPGSGKTMAAEVIANEIGLEIYKVDVSRVVSKYIGETEKNLSEIFKEAETSNAILFFDEADALFGKRSEVKDAHDRYANVEIGYLLQRMEEYTGIVILATNLNQNIDEAFLRRLHFNVVFPFPDKEQRKLIWQGIFPANAPIESNLDYDFLAEKLILAGGNIKNIALNAAFYAAHAGCTIGIKQIMQAAKREYKKMGKSFLKSDFAPYYQLIEVMK
jgi:SpoVK/Ycf46/Vps4 family AAA+-type ATPase